MDRYLGVSPVNSAIAGGGEAALAGSGQEISMTRRNKTDEKQSGRTS